MTDGHEPSERLPGERLPGEPLPPGWDAQSVPPAPGAIDDEVLAGHLRRRATHRPLPRTYATAIVQHVDGVVPVRRWRLVLAAWRPRVAVAVSGLTLVLLAGLLYVGSGPTRNGGLQTLPPTPNPTPSAAPVGVRWDPTVRALTPPDLLRVLATSPAPGTVLIVDDQIVPLLITCVAADHCPSGELRNAHGVRIEAPPGGHLPYLIDPTIATTSITGPLALRVGSGPNLEFLGAVVGNGLRLAFTADDLLRRSASGGLFVIPGWLWATPPAPCPSRPGTPEPMPTSELGLEAPRLACWPTDWLTDTQSTDPARGGGIGFPVQHGAHGAFAVDPSGAAGQANPSQGVYLVRDWAGYGEVLARLEPLFVPSDEATAPTTEPTAGPTVRPSPSTAGGLVMSVDELLRRVEDHSLTAGAIAIASIPASAVSTRWAPGAVQSCPQLCPKWHLFTETHSTDVVVSMEAPAPRSIVGVQAFLVLDDARLRALGPTATWPTGAALDGEAVIPIADGLSAVHGFLRIGPPLLCPQRPAPLETGILGVPLSWSQCPGTWILPFEGVDPWAGPPASQAPGGSGSIAIGDLSVPDGTLHVQDGAQHAGLDAQGGLWLVRSAVTNACPPRARCLVTNPDIPQPGITWYELVGPIVPPAPTTPVPEPSTSPSPSPVVLSQERLVADVRSGAIQPGSIVIASTTIAPVILPSFPPDPGTVAGKIGPLRVHWASDPSLDAADPNLVALRVRPDGELDYLGPVDLGSLGRRYPSPGLPTGSTNGLFVVQGWDRGPILVHRVACVSPANQDSCVGQADPTSELVGPVFVPTP